ncbi:MAG: CBS domain-containing protein [Deltaproteobacteria bacterium]|nr:CBS domain-containing protein [Deltaproteobacteria bacterium]
MIAASIMSTEIVTLRPDDTIARAVELLARYRIRAIPVIDDEKKVVGLIVPRKVLRAALPRYISSGDLKDIRFAPELPNFAQRINDMALRNVSEFMDGCFIKVTPETSAMEVAALFVNTEPQTESIIVVDDASRLLGIISPWDLFKRILIYTQKNETGQ